ncbi:unnamed protein product [Didymodactylos carnosus]|uniref:Cytochrome P450 n=1 Tax=Didymodactylos carnosus TaxID=1234261 RepID=A0A8S2D939_9BILA|nr:unnamed protein product [Didymodactylos carnosus]CAF3618166.1 unnamed protein product [Didymodactylos carnosus]
MLFCLGHDEIDVQMRKDYPKGLQNDSLKELIAHFVQNIREEMIKDKQELKNTIKTCGLLDLCHLMIFVPSIRTIYGEIDVHSYEKSFEKFNSNIQLLFINVPSFIKSTFFQKTLNARDYLIQQLSNIEHVQNQSRMTKMRTDLMKMYPQYFSSSDIGGNHLAFLWASVGNTIPAAFWTLFHILRDCRALEQLQEEVRENLPVLKLDENIEFDENSWTVEKLAKCVLLESAVNETLRMYGAPMMLRTCSSNTQIQTYDGKTLSIRKNDRISLFPAASHYDERLFHEPFIYKFDRFLNNTIINNLELDRQKVPIAYMPFGTGKTMCPGKYFAKNEIKICLALIFQQIEYKFIDETTPKTRADRVGFGVAPPSKDVQIQYWYQ